MAPSRVATRWGGIEGDDGSPPPPPRENSGAEGRGARGKPWSKPVIRCLSVVAANANGGKRSYSLDVYEGQPDSPYPTYSPQSVEQAS